MLYIKQRYVPVSCPLAMKVFGIGNAISGFSSFVTSGSGGGITLAAMTILNFLASQLNQNVFDLRIVSSSKVHIETVGSGVVVAGLADIASICLGRPSIVPNDQGTGGHCPRNPVICHGHTGLSEASHLPPQRL